MNYIIVNSFICSSLQNPQSNDDHLTHDMIWYCSHGSLQVIRLPKLFQTLTCHVYSLLITRS